MSVNGINGINSVNSANHVSSASYAAHASHQIKNSEVSVSTSAKDGSAGAAVKKTDSFVRSPQFVSAETTEGTEKTKGLSSEQVQAMKDMQKQSMQNMVKQVLGQQIQAATGLNLYEAFGTEDIDSILAELPEIATNPEDAKKAISEDGAWGVNAVSTRLMDMALALSGGDSEKAELLREAVQKGFDEVRGMFGSELPTVCEDTYDETMKRFDYWAENGSMEGYVME